MPQQPASRLAEGLPKPAGWRSGPSRSLLVNLGVLIVLTIGLGLVALLMLVVGDGALAAIFAGGSGLVALIVIGPVILLRTTPGAARLTFVPAQGAIEGGLRIPYSAGWYAWVCTLLATLFLGFAAVLTAIMVRGADQFGVSAGRMYGLLVIAVPAIPVLGWILLEILTGRMRRGWLLLTPRGIHHRGMVHQEFAAWEDVFAVSATDRRGMPVILVHVEPGRLQWAGTSRLLFSHKRGGPTDATPSIELPIYLFAVNPVLAYHALQFYRANPERRGELAGELGLRRIRAGDLLPG